MVDIFYNQFMKILVYYKDGFVHKYALDKPIMTIGRDGGCDLVINEAYVSRRHLEIMLLEDHVLIRDLNSTNGTYFDGMPIVTAKLKTGDSFSFKGIDFFLQEGSPDAFAPAKELIPFFEAINKETVSKIEQIETKDFNSTFDKLLEFLLSKGMKSSNISDLLVRISPLLEGYKTFGSLFIVHQQDAGQELFFSIHANKKVQSLLGKVLKIPEIFHTTQFPLDLSKEIGSPLLVYPFSLTASPAAILYFPKRLPVKEAETIFLNVLAKELELLSGMIGPRAQSASPMEEYDNAGIVTADPVMWKLIKQTKRIARSDIFVLIEGESGTGKELFARMIHQFSPRSREPFVAINCAAIPDTLLESELFGYDRGAFTGAHSQKKGKLEIASGGTLVLDEIGDMPVGLQSKLLRALEERSFYRLGGVHPIQVNLRIISLTNKNLNRLIEENTFRDDLYYRLVHHTLSIPPLRDRPQDILPLIKHFTRTFCHNHSRIIRGFSSDAYAALRSYPWPGNVRQLKNEINRLINLADEGEMVDMDLLSEPIKRPGSSCQAVRPPEAPTLKTEKEHVIELLDFYKGNRKKTAQALEISYQALWKKLKRLGIGNKKKSGLAYKANDGDR